MIFGRCHNKCTLLQEPLFPPRLLHSKTKVNSASCPGMYQKRLSVLRRLVHSQPIWPVSQRAKWHSGPSLATLLWNEVANEAATLHRLLPRSSMRKMSLDAQAPNWLWHALLKELDWLKSERPIHCGTLVSTVDHSCLERLTYLDSCFEPLTASISFTRHY